MIFVGGLLGSLTSSGSASPEPSGSASSLAEQTANAIAWPVRAVLIVVIGFAIAVVVRWIAHRLIDRLVRSFTDNALSRRIARTRAGTTIGLDDEATIARLRQRTLTVGGLLKSISTFVVFSLTVIIILAVMGLNVAPILASAGVIGIAIGFGAQSLVRDFLTGLFMIMEDQFGVGDVIDAGQAVGTVEDFGLRLTRIRDDSGVVWYVPNGAILRVGNRSHGWGLAAVDVPLANSEDLERALRVVKDTVDEVITGDEHANDVLDTPATVNVESITPFGVTLRVTVRTRALRNGAVAQTLRTRILAAFERDGIASPGLATPISAVADEPSNPD